MGVVIKNNVNQYLIYRVIIVLSMPVIFYWNELNILFNEAINNESSNYVIAIPFMIVYFLYRKRIAFMNSNYDDSNNKIMLVKDLIGISLILLSLLIKINVVDSFYQFEYGLLSLPIFISGVILILFNISIFKLLLYPILFLLFLTPPPLALIQVLGNSLSDTSSTIAYNVLSILINNVELSRPYGSPYITVITQNNETINFVLDIACSGIYSLIGIALFVTFLIYVLKGSIRNKIFLPIIGFPLIYGLNILRIVIIVVIGYYFGSGLSLTLFHTIGGGILIMIGSIILLIISEKILHLKFILSIKNKCDDEIIFDSYCINCGQIVRSNINSWNLSRLPVFILLLSLTASPYIMQIPGFESSSKMFDVDFSNLDPNTDAAILLPEITNYTLQFVYRDVLFQNISNQEASLMYLYEPVNDSQEYIWTAISVANTLGDLHAWDVCLLPTIRDGYGTEYDLRDINILEDPPIIGRYFAFSEYNSENIQVTLFWFTRGVFKTDGGNFKKWVMLSLISNTYNSSEINEIEAYLLPVAKNVAQLWYPLSYMSDKLLFISQMIPLINIIVILSTIFIVIINIYNQYNKKRIAKLAFSKITNKEDINILNIIKEMRDKIISDSKISKYYNEKEENKIDIVDLHKKLLAAEHLGIIERKIVYNDDAAYLSWYRI